MTAQTIIKYLQNTINSDADDPKVWDAINAAVRTIARYHAWSSLRRTVDVTATDSDTEGSLMPANMINVIDPLMDENGWPYERLDASLVGNPPSHYKQYFYFDAAATTPLVTRTRSVAIDNRSTALTFDPVLTISDPTGEFIRIVGNDGTDWGLYEMATAGTLVNTYNGERINGGFYSIRPAMTKRISFTDYAGARLAATPTVHYWIYPDPTLAPEQELPDVWEEALKMKAILELTTETFSKKTENVRLSRIGQYKVALSEAKASDPLPPMQDLPRDNTGSIRTIGWRGRCSSYRR